MSNSTPPLADALAGFGSFGKLVPGFDFLQNLAASAAKGAATGAAQGLPQIPSLGGWIAPTLNVEDLEKRIAELKAVQFWLDQNATALKATIQALEVQKMTLATLKGMNFSMGELANAFKVKAADTVKSFAAAAPEPEPVAAPAPQATAKKASSKAPAPGVVDPMQWWGSLTEQFQAIAASALKDAAKQSAVDLTKTMASSMAKDAVKSATAMATNLAMGTAKAVGKQMASATKTVATKRRTPLAPAVKAAKTASRAPRKRA